MTRGAISVGAPLAGARNAFWIAKAVAVLTLAALLTACGGEDRPQRPNVEVIGGTDTVSVSASSIAPEPTGPSTPRQAGSPTAAAPSKYAPSSNVDPYFAMGADLRDMRAAMPAGGTPNFAAVEELYTRGKNQTLANGMVRPLANVPNDAVHAVFPNGAAVYGRPNFIDAIIRDGLAGTGRAAGLPPAARRQIVEKGILVLFYGKALQEFEAARVRLASNAANPNVPVDEVWAILAGPSSSGSYPDSLLATAASRERDFKLEGKLAAPLEASLAAALSAAQRGDRAAFDSAYAEGRGYINAIFYLSTLRNAKVLEADTTQAARQEHLAEGWTYFQAIRAVVAIVNPGAAQAIDDAYRATGSLAWTPADTARIYAALNQDAILHSLNIPAALQVKTPPTP
jgi:hypothetical protein